MRRSDRPLHFAMACVLMSVVASGCGTGGAPESTWPVVELETMSVPEFLRPTAPRINAGPLVRGDATLPWVTGGSSAEPGRAGVPTAWVSDDAKTWRAIPVAAGFSGSFRGNLRGGRDLVAIAGTVWRDGVETGALWTSTDRRTWTERRVPSAFAEAFTVTDFDVDGTTVYLLGTDSSGRQSAVSIDAGDTSRDLVLPAVGAGEVLGGWRLEVDRATVLLLARPGVEGTTQAPAVIRSGDAGATWSAPNRLTDARGYLGGITQVGGGYVIAGSVRRGAGPTDPSVPAAWHSSDGVRWAPETVPGPPPESALAPYTGVYLENPDANDGVVVAAAVNSKGPSTGFYRRSVDGTWEFAGNTGTNAFGGATGTAMAGPDRSIVVRVDDGGSRFGTVGADQIWTEGQRLSERNQNFGTSTVVDPSQRLIRASRQMWTMNENRQIKQFGHFELLVQQGNSAVSAKWQPSEAETLTNVTMATGPGGAQATLGSLFDQVNATVTARGWWRANAGSGWRPVTGFDPAKNIDIDDVAHLGQGWVAAGAARPDIGFTTRGSAQIWTSTDGVAWQAAKLQVSGELSSRAYQVCVSPKGVQTAVGWVENTVGQTSPAAWQLTGEQWQRVDLGEAGKAEGELTGCATGSSGLAVHGTVGGRSAVLFSAGDTAWQQVAALDRGSSLGHLTARPGGFVAGGSVRDGNENRPALWVSIDGVTWRALAIPSFAAATSRIGALGEDIAVFLPADAGDPISIVHDIDAVIAEHGR